MDIHMPVMDGIEAATKILELDAGIPIIAMTANIFSSDRQMYKESGMNDCVGKPFTSHELWRCLLRYLNPVSWQSVNGNGHTNVEGDLRYALLKSFYKDHQNRAAEIETAINTGDIKLAHRLAHTLSSTAGQLGKTNLQRASANLEHHLKNGKNLVTKEELKVFGAELDTVLAQFSLELKDSSQKKAEVSKAQSRDSREQFDAKSALELFAKLEPLFKRGDPECLNSINDLERVPGSEDRLITRLIQQMENFDFDQALDTLAKLKKKISKG